MNIKENLISNISKKRNELGLSIRNLAKRADISEKTLRKIISGETANPTVININKVASSLGCTTSDLIGESEICGQKEIDLLEKIRRLDKTEQKLLEEFLDNLLRYQDNKQVIRQIPLYNLKVSAGTGNFLDTYNFDYISIDNEEVGSKNAFALKVSGDSMEPLLFDQDTVIIEPSNSINNNDIVVAIINGNAFIKKYDSGKFISLNSKYEPIIPNEYDQIQIVGKYLKKID